MTATTPMSSPGVRFPPPFIYTAGIVIGWLLHRVLPLVLPSVSDGVYPVLAAVLTGAWLLMLLWSFATFFRARTSIIPNRPAAVLVTSGPYRMTRNPMYMSLTALYLGLTIILRSWWPLILLPVVLLIIRRYVIAREERYLAGAFPLEYPAYCARVRRWL